MRRKKAEGAPAPADGGARVTPTDIQQVEFRLAFRGYNERDVDAFLDRVTEDLAAYIEESRATASVVPAAGTAPAVSGTDAAATEVSTARIEAERILADAREEAQRILSDAEVRAAAIGTPVGDPRSSVAPFLSKEREFLQGLGALVQGHAEEVKQMVLALRARAEQAAGTQGAAAVAGTEGPSEAASARQGAGAEREPLGAEETLATPASEASDPSEDTPPTAEEAFAPISVPEADGADVGTEPEPAPAQLRRDSGERSLRELFWGED